jgi:hypothetical protein
MHRDITILGWWFCNGDELPNSDGRKIVVGKTHIVKGEIKLCHNGLHASKLLVDALSYAPGSNLYRVELSGKVLNDDNKMVASQRKYLWHIDAEKVMRRFTRRCALDVVHLWDAPEIVVRYLKTGDEDIRAAARDAAWAAAWDAARNATKATAWAASWAASRDAAWAASRADAAWDAARDAARATAWAAAWDAARATARATAMKKQNKRLTQMVIAEKRRHELAKNDKMRIPGT